MNERVDPTPSKRVDHTLGLEALAKNRELEVDLPLGSPPRLFREVYPVTCCPQLQFE